MMVAAPPVEPLSYNLQDVRKSIERGSSAAGRMMTKNDHEVRMGGLLCVEVGHRRSGPEDLA
jgi:hypothetical protein